MRRLLQDRYEKIVIRYVWEDCYKIDMRRLLQDGYEKIIIVQECY